MMHARIRMKCSILNQARIQDFLKGGGGDGQGGPLRGGGGG